MEECGWLIVGEITDIDYLRLNEYVIDQLSEQS